MGRNQFIRRGGMIMCMFIICCHEEFILHRVSV